MLRCREGSASSAQAHESSGQMPKGKAHHVTQTASRPGATPITFISASVPQSSVGFARIGSACGSGVCLTCRVAAWRRDGELRGFARGVVQDRQVSHFFTYWSGSLLAPFLYSERCRWQAVESPVEPTSPMRSPLFIRCPPRSFNWLM